MLYHLRGIPRNDKWKVFPEVMMDKNATMTAKPDEIITKLVQTEAVIERDIGLAPDALLFAKKGGKGGRSPTRDKKDNKRDNKGDNDRKEKDFPKGFRCQQRGHTTENCSSKQRGDPPKGCRYCSKRFNSSIGYFDSHHIDRELLNGGQLNYFIQ
jgi:hypothetical protein